MMEITPTGTWDSELPPVLVISSGKGNDPHSTEVFLAIRRGNRHEAIGWYPLNDLLIAAHTAGATSAGIDQSKMRLTEPFVDEVAA